MCGLTARETDLVMGLLDGATPADIAERMGISVGHLRQRLKMVYAKVGVNSQAKLVATVLRRLPLH